MQVNLNDLLGEDHMLKINKMNINWATTHVK